MTDTQLNLQFDKNFKFYEASELLKAHEDYSYVSEVGTVYICSSQRAGDYYKIEGRVFQGPEVDWYYLTTVDFETAAYFVRTGLAQLHWTLREKPGELRRFNEWV